MANWRQALNKSDLICRIGLVFSGWFLFKMTGKLLAIMFFGGLIKANIISFSIFLLLNFAAIFSLISGSKSVNIPKQTLFLSLVGCFLLYLHADSLSETCLDHRLPEITFMHYYCNSTNPIWWGLSSILFSSLLIVVRRNLKREIDSSAST